MLEESMKLCLAAALGAGAGYIANQMRVLNLLVKKISLKIHYVINLRKF